SGSTLHRLLGTIPDSPRFRHDADNPLPFDVVVVDEASMIDLPLMAKLVDAVPDGTRLVLIGDPDQLPSVEAGDVLSGIIAGADLTSPARGRGRAEGAGEGPLPARRTHLTKSWRQHEALDLAPPAAAVRDGGTARAWERLRSGQLSAGHSHAELSQPLQTHRANMRAHSRALAEAETPAQALSLASRLRLLTAV